MVGSKFTGQYSANKDGMQEDPGLSKYSRSVGKRSSIKLNDVTHLAPTICIESVSVATRHKKCIHMTLFRQVREPFSPYSADLPSFSGDCVSHFRCAGIRSARSIKIRCLSSKSFPSRESPWAMSFKGSHCVFVSCSTFSRAAFP